MNNSLQELKDRAQSGLNSANNAVAAGQALLTQNLFGANQAGSPTKPSTFASTTWSTGATDELATADVYDTVAGGNPITDVKSFFDGIDFGLADLVRGGKFLAKNIPLITGLARGGMAIFDRTSLTSRILGASTLFNSAFRDIAARNPDLSDGLLKTIKDTGGLYASVNGVIQRVASTSFTDINSVGRLINAYTGKNDLFSLEDMDGQVGMIAGIVNEATRFGIPNSFAGLTSQITNTEIVRRVADRVLPDVVASGDTLSLKAIGETMGARGTLSLNPNVIGDFSGKYVTPYMSTVTDTRAAFRNIFDAYEAVDDSWKMKDRAGTSVVNLNQILSGSKDFISVVSDGAKALGQGNEKLFALANVVRRVDVEDDLKRRFPATVWKNNSTLANPIRDPMALGANPKFGDWRDQVEIS